MFRHCTTKFRCIMFDTSIVGALRRRCFPVGETTGRIISAPTTPRNFRSVIRWHHLRRGGYQPPANVASFWAEPSHTSQCQNVANIPCFYTIPPNINEKYLTLHCRHFAPTLFPRWGNNRAADSRPYERSEITPAVIRWHPPTNIPPKNRPKGSSSGRLGLLIFPQQGVFFLADDLIDILYIRVHGI